LRLWKHGSSGRTFLSSCREIENGKTSSEVASMRKTLLGRISGFVALLLIAAALWACKGGGGGSGNAGDTNVSDPEDVDLSPPAISASYPADGTIGVTVDKSCFKVDFSENIVAGQSMFSLAGDDDCSIDSITQEDNAISVFLSRKPLKQYTKYTLTISGLTDKAGNIMPTTAISFTTGATDTTLPTITYSEPGNGSVGVDVNVLSLYFEFSENVVLNSSMIEISPAVAGMAGERFISFEDWVYIDLSGLTLASNQVYTVTFTGVRDLSGNVMPNSSISFTTEGPVPVVGRSNNSGTSGSWVDIWAH